MRLVVYLMYLMTVLFVAAFPTAVSAAGTVDISPIYSAVDQGILTLAAGLIMAFFAWLSFWLQRIFHVDMDAKMRDALNTALQNGVMAGMHSLQAWQSVHKDIAVQGAVTRWAAQYAIDHVPDAVDHFGLSPEDLVTKALAFIPTPKEQIAPQLPPRAPVETHELPVPAR